MPTIDLSEPSGAPLDADRLNDEGELWPWIHRFFWEPAKDLHPDRRAASAPGWPDEAWNDRRCLGQLSRHLVAEAGSAPALDWNSDASAFRLALLPSDPLSRLAHLIGLILGGDGGETAEDAKFIAQRTGLFWRRRGEAAAPCSGWQALRLAISGQPEAVRRRFEGKTPLDSDASDGGESPQALLALAQRILREFDEPWSVLFVTPGR